MPLKGFWIRLILATFISLPLFWLVLKNVDFVVLRNRLNQADVGWLFGAAVFMGLLQLIGGLRICQLLRLSRSADNPSLGRAIIISCAHQSSQRFLPLRLGEAVMIWMVSRLMRVGGAANLRSWVVLRLWDFRFVAVGFAIGVGSMMFERASGYLVLALCAVPALVLMIISPIRLLKLCLWAIRLVNSKLTFNLCSKMSKIFQESIEQLNCAQKIVPAVPALAFLGWFCSWMIYYCLLHALGFQVNLLHALGITCGTALISAIPLQTVAGLGINETGQIAVFILAGLQSSSAASLSLAFSLIHMALCLLVPAAIAGIAILCLNLEFLQTIKQVKK